MERRGSISSILSGLGLSSESANDSGEVDSLLRGSLYPYDPAILEKRWTDSLNADYSPEVPAPIKISNTIDNKHNGSAGAGTNGARSTEEVVEGLRIEYFTPNYDPIEDHLIEISSWNEKYGNDNDDIIQLFMNKIEETDTDKDIIIGHLTSMIDANYDDLMDCINNVKSVSVDLKLAGEHIKSSRRKINGASEVIQSGAIKIKALQQRREKLEGISETIRSLKALKDVHRAMMSSINTGEVGKAADYARSVLTCLKNDSYENFSALHKIGYSMQRSIITIRQKTDKALKRLCCRKFAALEYENIIQSYLALDHLAETMNVQLCDLQNDENDDEDDTQFDSFGCIDGLASRINRYQFKDIDSCLHTAVMEYIYASQQEKEKAAAQLDVVGAYATMNLGEIVDLAEGPLSDLYRRLSCGLMAPCVVRTCELLADTIHTHYLITQWHLTPFDEKNNDPLYLHRCPVDIHSATNGIDSSIKDSVDEDEEYFFHASSEMHHSRASNSSIKPSFDMDHSSSSISSKKLQTTGSFASGAGAAVFSSALDKYFTALDLTEDLEAEASAAPGRVNRSLLQSYRAKLTQAYCNLSASRAMLWEELLQSLVEMLSMMSFTSAVKSDEYLAMVWALNAMVSLGKEFCGSESGSLRKCLDDKSREYFANFHSESFLTLRQMLQEECWQNMPLSQTALRQMGGVLGIVKSHCPKNDVAVRKLRQHCTATAEPRHSSSDSLQSKFRRSSIRYGAHDSKMKAMVDAGLNKNRSRTDSTTSASNNSEESPASQAVADETDLPVNGPATILMMFGLSGNPFHFMTNEDDNDLSRTSNSDSNAGVVDKNAKNQRNSKVNVNGARKEIDKTAEPDDTDGFWQILNDDTDGSHANSSAHMVVTQTALNGLSKYAANYLHMMYILPDKAQEIFHSLLHLFDFYVCSIFNAFVPADEKSKFLAKPTKLTSPAPDQCRDYEGLLAYLERVLDAAVLTSNSSPTKRVTSVAGRRGSLLLSTSSSGPNSPTGFTAAEEDAGDSSFIVHSSGGAAEASKMASLLIVPDLIQSADVSNMFLLNERIVAAESCWFVAKILVDLKPKILTLTSSSFRATCEQLISQFQVIAGQLRSLIYRSVCPLLIRHNTMLPQITENCGWDSKKLRENTHDWVDKLVQIGKDIWEYLSESEQFAESSTMVREQAWMEVCQSFFDLVMEGYSKVRKVSLEGRSAMTMDVFALHEGLNSVHLCRPPRGKHHIDNFLRTAYMSEEDMMQWIQENWRAYSYKHILGLLVQTLSSSAASALLSAGGGGRRLKEAVAVIDGLYEIIESSSALASTGTHSSGGSSMNISSLLALAGQPRRGSVRLRDPDNSSSNSGSSSILSPSNPASVDSSSSLIGGGKLSQLFNKR